MDFVAKLCIFLMLCGVGHSKDLKPDLYTQGDTATLQIDQLRMTGNKILEINFFGYASKLHVTNVMLYDTTKKHHNNTSINRNYTSRIKNVKRSNNSLSFLLLNVTFMDSGNYTMFEDSFENGKTSILVARYILTGQDKAPMVLPFAYNSINTSTIQIEMHIPSINFPVLMYDVKKENCTNFGQLYMARIQNCLLSGNRFSFIFRDVSWLDKGIYAAWDDKGFILDTIMVDFEEGTRTLNLETTKGYVTVPSTANTKQNEFSSTSHVQKDNVIVINVSGYRSMLHVTNVMLIDPKNNQHDSGSSKINYTGQIQMIVINNESLSFQLLNVTFVNESLSFQLLNVTFVQNEDIKGLDNSNAKILVLGRRLVQQDDESGTQVLMCNYTNMYSNKTDIMQTNVTSTVGVNNVTHRSCTLVPQNYSAVIQGCVFSNDNFSFTCRDVSRLNGTIIAAYNGSQFLLDSIFINIQGLNLETRNEYQTSSIGAIFRHDPPRSNEKSTLLLVSAVVVVIVAACLAMIALKKIRHGRVPNTESNHITYKNREKPTANSSRNLYQNVQKAILPEETRMVLAENNDADNRIDKSSNKGQVKVRLKEENTYHRRFDYADSSPRITRSFQIDSIAHVYDYIHENHDHCLSYESNLRSSPNSTESIAEPWFEYDYVVQHSFMTLRPPAPDPVATRKTKDRGTRADSTSWYQRINIKSSSRVDPLTLYSKINKMRSRESNCTVFSSEPGSRDVINQLGPSSYFELEGIRATDTMKSPGWLTYGGGPNWRKVEKVNSSNFVPGSEFSELRAISKSGRVAQFRNYDYPRSYFDHPSAMDRRHRRSQSLSDMMAIASVRWSKRKSARSYMKTDCYDSL